MEAEKFFTWNKIKFAILYNVIMVLALLVIVGGIQCYNIYQVKIGGFAIAMLGVAPVDPYDGDLDYITQKPAKKKH